MIFKKTQAFFKFLILSLLLSSCYYCADPSWKGDVAPCYNTKWIPPAPITEAETGMMAAEKCGPWDVAELLEMALRNNPDTRKAWEDARIAAYTWEASKAPMFPSIDFQESLQINKQNFGSRAIANIAGLTSAGGSAGTALASLGLAGGNTSTDTVTNGPGIGFNELLIRNLSASWLMIDFGGRLSSIESAHHALFSANWIHNREIQNVMLQVLMAYYSYINNKALIASTLVTLKDAEETLKSAELQFESGINTIVDVLQAKSSYVNIQLVLQQYYGQLEIAHGQLAKAIGLHANADFNVVDLPEDLPLEKISENVDELIAVARLERPDLASAQSYVQQKNYDVVTAYSAGMPTVTANAIYDVVRNIHESSLNSRFYSGMVTLNFPVFSGFLYMNQYRAAKESLESAYAVLQSTEAQVYLDVVTSYNTYKTAVETLTYAKELLNYTQKAFDGALASYQNGVGTILDVLNAQFNLANARTQVIQARTQWLVSLANISYATGTL